MTAAAPVTILLRFDAAEPLKRNGSTPKTQFRHTCAAGVRFGVTHLIAVGRIKAPMSPGDTQEKL